MKTIDTVELYQRLAEILDKEEVKPANVLKDFDGWDSLAILSVLAMAESKYRVSIKAEEIRSVVTSLDLAHLLESKHKCNLRLMTSAGSA